MKSIPKLRVRTRTYKCYKCKQLFIEEVKDIDKRPAKFHSIGICMECVHTKVLIEKR